MERVAKKIEPVWESTRGPGVKRLWPLERQDHLGRDRHFPSKTALKPRRYPHNETGYPWRPSNPLEPYNKSETLGKEG